MKEILRDLLSMADKTYADFSAKLTPNIDRGNFLGIKVPVLRNYAKKLDKTAAEKFLNELPHRYFDENMLHGLIVSEIKDYNFCVEKLTEFLPYVDNWATTDQMSPGIFKICLIRAMVPISYRSSFPGSSTNMSRCVTKNSC